ncbi:hypothetical protein TTHERM_00242340 (macronuclear) [Tetrahymena thermophila SB210]|uniref:Uncharacterized protein n=1 Tax=Tetrahymena thermophila (strain SB210) TaxID=312017 RepID=I7LXI6_TETTS|nr:hypothetical protein TTHERM_00242340 [Tetrahymena thermophila SB210]EAS04712.1 hypothetical protein TTHERM_00242340 [Tetrahymena thermophila SB210]|eukprot:XP_001024957.1 hypothetical protein TTHERM_00242340 [Tetrahymena thermophila SB210]
MKASQLAEKRKQIEESLQRNDRDRKNFIEKNPQFLNESEGSSSQISENISSPSLKNESELFNQQMQKFNSISPNLNKKHQQLVNKQKTGQFEDNDESIHELIEEHILSKNDRNFSMESSSDLEYSQSHQIMKKTSNSVLKKQIMNNSSGVEEFSFQNNFGMENSNIKISNIFTNNNSNNIMSNNNLQSIFKSDNQNIQINNNFQNENTNYDNYFGEQKAQRNQIYANKQVDNILVSQKDSEGLQRIEEERNSQQNFYSNQYNFGSQTQKTNQLYQLSSSSSQKGTINYEQITNSLQNNNNIQRLNQPFVSNNSNNSENINVINYSNQQYRQPQWILSQSLYQQQPSVQLVNPPSLHDNSQQSSFHLHNNLQNNNSSVVSSSVRAHFPFNQPSQNQQYLFSGQKDYEFFRLNRDNQEPEFNSDMRQQYEKIYELQASPNKNENISKINQASPYQKYSQYQYEKQQASLQYQKMVKEQRMNSIQNSEKSNKSFQNTFQSNDNSRLISKNLLDKSPQRHYDSVRTVNSKFESQRNKFERDLENHIRKYSPHSRPTTQELENSLKEELRSSKVLQINHLQDIYNSYKFGENSSAYSSSSEESLQQSLGQSIKLQIQKALAKQNGVLYDDYDNQYQNDKKANQQKFHDHKLAQQYTSNQSDNSVNSNPLFVHQLEEDMELMKTQVVPKDQIIIEDKDDFYDENENLSDQEQDKEQFEVQIQENSNDNNAKEYDEAGQHSHSLEHQSEQHSLQDIQISSNKKTQNKYPSLYHIDQDDNKNKKSQALKNKSMADFQNYQGNEVNPKDWRKYNLLNEQQQQPIEEANDDENMYNIRDEEEEQKFQNQQADEELKTDSQIFNHGFSNQMIQNHEQEQKQEEQELTQEQLQYLNDLDENKLLDWIDELFQAVNKEKEKKEDEERKHQYELIQLRLMNLIPQDQEFLLDQAQRDQKFQEKIEELMNIQKLFVQILIQKQGQQKSDQIEDISPDDYEGDIQNLLTQLKQLDQKLQELVNQRQARNTKNMLSSKNQSQSDSKLIDNYEKNKDVNHENIFDQSRKHSTAQKSLMELGDYIQKQNQEYIQNESDFMNMFNPNELNNNNNQGQYLELNEGSQNQLANISQKSLRHSQQTLQQIQEGYQDEQQIDLDEQQIDQDEQQIDQDEDDKITHEDLLKIMDNKFNQNQSHENLPPINSKSKLQAPQTNKLEESEVNEELEKELQEIRQKAQLKKEIQTMLKDKSDIIEKFKYRLEMKLNNEEDQVGNKGKKSALDEVDLSFQSEMKYEESLKHSSLYKDSKKQNSQKRKPSDDNNSERSAPAIINNKYEIQDENEKSDLDKTLQEKLKHELFLDLENFKKSDIFKNLYHRKLKDLINSYVNMNIKQQVRDMCRVMKVMQNAKLFYQNKQENIKQNCFNVIKWYSDYSRVKNNRKIQIEQNMKVKNMELKTIAFAKIKKFCVQHKKWIEAIHENNKMMKIYKVYTEWKKIVNYKAMKRQADLYYKNTLFQKFKNKINEVKNSVDVRALMHYSSKLQNQFFTLFCSTAQTLRKKRLGLNQKVNKINSQLLSITFSEWKKYTQAKKQEKNDYISIQICIKDTISKPKIQPNQTLQDYKKAPITTQKTIKVIMPPDSAFK